MDVVEFFFPMVTILSLSMGRMFIICRSISIFSINNAGMSVKLAVIMALSLPLMPVGFTEVAAYTSSLDGAVILLLILKEVILGFGIGLLVGFPFNTLQSAGVLIDNQRGANMQAINPLADPDASILGEFMEKTLGVLMIETGLFVLLMQAIYASYVYWPVLHLGPMIDMNSLPILIDQFSHMIILMCLLAAPVLVGLGFIECSFAILSRWAPQLPAYSAALPVKSIVAVLMLLVSSTVIFNVAEGEIENTIKSIRVFLFPTQEIADAAIEAREAFWDKVYDAPQ